MGAPGRNGTARVTLGAAQWRRWAPGVRCYFAARVGPVKWLLFHAPLIGYVWAVDHRDRHRLLHGPYRPPALRRGDRAVCLARDCDVIVTSWTDARISWPRCRALGHARRRSGILVDEVLAGAIRNESAAAIGYWWGVPCPPGLVEAGPRR